MNQLPVKLGPLALLLAVFSICLSILSILSFTTARADIQLSEKYAQTVSDRYALELEGQKYVKEQADRRMKDPAFVPEDSEKDEEGIYWKTLKKEKSRLQIGLLPAGRTFRVTAWKYGKEWEQDTDPGNLW